jgi:hypothetical protein
MSDEPTITTEAPAVDVATTETAPAVVTDTAATTERTYTAAEYKAVQNEARNLRQRLRDLETQHNTVAQTAEVLRSDLEAFRSERETLLSETRTYRLRDAISAAANGDDALRGLDPALAARLIEGVEWGDDGKPKGIGAKLKTLVSEYPQLVAASGPRLPVQRSATTAPGATVTTDQVIEQKRRSGRYPTM